MRSRFAIILTVAFAVAVAHADDQKNKKDDPSQIGNRDVGKGINFYTLQREMALGKQLAQEVAREAKLNTDPILAEYINRLGQNLARNSDAKVPFTFQVIEGEAPNAFALPGGYIFVYTGLLDIASEEDELAGAVAHEIAHVAARHMTRRATKSEIANIASIPLSVLLGGWGGYAARQAAGVAVPMTFLKFSRSDETEADYLGVQYMYAAGYDPNGAVSIFEKIQALQRTNPGLAARLFSTHPMDADRIDRTQKEIQRILPSKPEYVVTTSEYHDVRARLIAAQNRRKSDENDGRPRLRVAPGSGQPGQQDDKDERPTIKRRDLME
ncbi:Peptidase M48, Ste24p [Candidatus Sulfopaludibacter sp. SbA4]|nr:Peptidase M48, Ste24p [Candidatus Sulfopaludibacter sp. SbA4]